MLLTIACVLVILYVTLRTWPLVPILAGIAVAGYAAFWALLFAIAWLSPKKSAPEVIAAPPTTTYDQPNVYAPVPHSDSPHVAVYAPPISGPDAPSSAGEWVVWISAVLAVVGFGLFLVWKVRQGAKDPLLAAFKEADKRDWPSR